MPDHGSLDRHDQHWLRHERFVYAGREVTYDELRADAEGQAAGLDPDQWIGGEFDFDWRIHSEGLAPQNYSGSIRHGDENGWLTPRAMDSGRRPGILPSVGGRRDSGPPGSMASRRPTVRLLSRGDTLVVTLPRRSIQ
jgi:hypothetical protein